MKLALIFALVLFAVAFTFPRWADWNQNSRFDLVQAIVEEHTLSIDDYRANTGDYALVRGHYYSDKAPGLAFVGVPIYIVFKFVAQWSPIQSLLTNLGKNQTLLTTLNPTGSGVNDNKLYALAGLTWVTFFTVAIPSVILSVLLFKTLGRWLESRTAVGLATWGFIFATPALAYANLFVSHMLTAACLFGAYYLANMRRTWLVLLAIGFLLGYAVLCEYPAVFVAGAIFVYLLTEPNRLRTLIGVAVGSVPPMLLFGAYNWLAYGSPVAIGYTQSALFPEHFNSGILGVSLPQLDALWGLTFGPYRGLFFVSPFLLLLIPGLYWMWHEPTRRRDALLVAWCLVSEILFLSATQLWDGGFAVGPRYLILVLPFAMLPVGVAIDKLWSRMVWRVVVCILLALSAFIVWAESFGGTSFPQYEPFPLFEYSLPRILNGELARNWAMVLHLGGIWSFLPWLIISLVLLLILSMPLLQHVYQSKSIGPSAVPS